MLIKNINLEEYKQSFVIIKNEILKSQYKAMQVLNKEMTYMYWNIGQEILKNSQWGDKYIDNLSIDLKLEFPNTRGFSIRNLKYMKKLAQEYPDFQFVQSVIAQIPWTHNTTILDRVDKIQREWYINETLKNGWSNSVLIMQIKTKVYERQVVVEKTTNFSTTLPDIQSDLAQATLKDPYIFNYISLKGQIKELELEKSMIEKIKKVLIELRKRLCFCR